MEVDAGFARCLNEHEVVRESRALVDHVFKRGVKLREARTVLSTIPPAP